MANPQADPPVAEKKGTAMLAIKGRAGAASLVKYRLSLAIYGDLRDALNKTSGYYVRFEKPILAVDPTVAVKITEAPNVIASVVSGFTKLKTSGTLATVNVAVAKLHQLNKAHTGWDIVSAGDGFVVDASDVLGSVKMTVTGDFSVGSFAVVGATSSTLHDADGEVLIDTDMEDQIKYTDKTGAAMAKFTLANAAGDAAFSFSVAADNTVTIPRSTYTADLDVAPAVTTAAAIPGLSGVGAGEIVRDGTTVHLGYLTTYEGHNQRLVIVNRGKLPATYSVGDFVTESGTTAMAGHMAEGSIMGGEAKVIQVRDVVSFGDGGTTRTAATLTMSAPKGAVSVATTLVNRMDRSTDTVTYQPE